MIETQTRVLLLDDNLMSALRIERGLQNAGALVQTRGKLPVARDFNLVVINLGSRSLDGLAQVETLRREVPDLPVWGFCGHREVEIWRAARALGIGKMLSNEDAMAQIGAALEAFEAFISARKAESAHQPD